MKIYGIGTDIISVDRIKKSMKNKIFLRRIFSNEEITKCYRLSNPNNCYAKRFAAKEAFAKALGTGISNGINFNEIIVINKSNGKPFIKLKGNTMQIIKKRLKKKFKINLSLSDEKKYAVAFVTISL
tara:strand:+ start:292 stop:672 length:381 start_codon:yes stop_codon:yes gene_type:complete